MEEYIINKVQEFEYESYDIIESSSNIYSHKIALVDYSTSSKYTYGDIILRGSKIAGFLENLSIKPRDRVAYILTNRIECIDLFIAVRKLGGILVPLNWRLSPSELTSMIMDVRPRVIVYEESFRELVEKSIPRSVIGEIIRVVVDGEARGIEHDYEEALSSQPIKTKRKIELEEPTMILFTGGTTGTPKGAIIPYRQVLFNIISEILTWRLKDDHKTVLLLPLFHTGGWNLLTLPLLAIGGSVYMMRRFDPKVFLEAVEVLGRHIVIFGVPTIYYIISKTEGFREASFENVEWMISGGAPIDRKIMENYWAKGVKMAQGYGITEGGPNNITMPIHDLSLDDIKTRWRSVGKPFAFNKIYIVDQDGSVLGPGTYGEIVICGPTIFSGYWGKERDTKEVLRNGCVYTGDIGYYDADGFFYIVDRVKEIIKSGGEQIYPREIEELVLQHPSVEDCAVIGVYDEKWGEVPKLVIKLRPDSRISKEDIIEYLRGKIARYKIPKYVAIVEDIPKSPAGKTLKKVLKEKHGAPRDEI